MSGYSISCDATPDAKVHKGGTHLQKWAQHVGRDLDDRAGTPRKHGNKGIDRDRTLLNETLVYDPALGEHVPAESVQQLIDSVTARVEEHGGRTAAGKRARPLTDQSVIMRPLILGLDEAWFEEHNPDWRENGLNEEAERLHSELLTWCGDYFGRENMRVISLHLDEQIPQLQIGLVPVNEHGQVSQRTVFTGPAQLKEMHGSVREYMRSVGYDASLENVTGKKSQTRLSDRAYKREHGKAEADLSSREQAVEEAERSIRRRRRSLDDREGKLNRRERDLDQEVQRRAAERVEKLKAAALGGQLAQARREALARVEGMLDNAEAHLVEVRSMVRELKEGTRMSTGLKVRPMIEERASRAAALRQQVIEEMRQEREAPAPIKPATDRDLAD